MSRSMLSRVMNAHDYPYIYLTEHSVMRTKKPLADDGNLAGNNALGCSAKVASIELNNVKINQGSEKYFLEVGGNVSWLEEEKIS